MRSIDLETLEIFRTVVQEGGIIRASEKLNRVQSNVTTRIKQLEQRLGVALFRKQGRKLVLSCEGQLLLSYTQRLFQLADEAENEVRGGTPRGVLRIGSLESTAGSRLPPVLSRFHRQYPGVIVELLTGTTGALIQRVCNYEVEAAFVSEPFTAPELSSMKVFEEELVLITSRAVPEVRRPCDLAGLTLIAFSEGCSYRRRLQDWLAASCVVAPRTLEFASYQAMIACVAAGTGFALVPKSLLYSLRTVQDVLQHEVPPRVRRNTTHLIWSGPPSSALQRLTSILQPQLRHLAA